MSATTYLISGTTRGIGRGLVQSLIARPNTTIIAGVRDTQAKPALALNDLPKGSGSKLILIKLNANSETDAIDAVSTLQKDHGINHLDTVIANAGILQSEDCVPIASVSASGFRSHFEVNTLAAILLFQATLPLLKSSPSKPTFVVTTSAIGSNTLAASGTLPVPAAAYGISKAAVNYFLAKATTEYPEITFVPIHPGLVDTDMAGPFVEFTKGTIPSISVETSVNGYLEQIEKAESGKFVQYDGEGLPW